MCGRTACTLAACDVRGACSYTRDGRRRRPQLHDNGQVYRPSHNLCPTDTSLVLVAGAHFGRSDEPRVLVPMIWGMIPPWHAGDSWKNHGLTTHNCRLEGVSSSRLYGKALNRGRRCVIVCNGFYEWQTTKGKANKMPYFIFNKQPEEVGVMDEGPWSWTEEDGWTGPTLLRIAGLFDTWRSPKGEELYSYTMITHEADDALAWLHHRQPAFLSTDRQVADWLDDAHVGAGDALALVRPPTDLVWYRVSTLVNSCHNKDPACSRPLAADSPKKPSKSAMMSAWLQRGASKRPSASADEDVKRVKLEESHDEGAKVKSEGDDVASEELCGTSSCSSPKPPR